MVGHGGHCFFKILGHGECIFLILRISYMVRTWWRHGGTWWVLFF